jgi:hypothetical protein
MRCTVTARQLGEVDQLHVDTRLGEAVPQLLADSRDGQDAARADGQKVGAVAKSLRSSRAGPGTALPSPSTVPAIKAN